MTGWAQQIVARNIRARDGINHLRASRARTSGSSYFIIFVQNFRFIYRMVSTQRPPVLIWKTLINDESWFEWNVLCDDSAEWGYSHGEILGTQPCRGGRLCCVTCHTMGGGYNQYFKYLVNTLNVNCGHQSLATVASTNITFQEGMSMWQNAYSFSWKQEGNRGSNNLESANVSRYC